MKRGETESLAEEVAKTLLAAGTDEEAKHVERCLSGHPMSHEIIHHLVGHRDPVVRIWAADRLADLPASKALPALRMLVADADGDVRAVAIDHVARIGSDSDRLTVVRALIHELQSPSFGANRFALWHLTRLRATESLGAIAKFRADRRNPWKDSAGSVAMAIIEGRDAEVIDWVRSHDHDRMQWLATGARIIGSASAIDALRACAADAPDEQCRADCASAFRGVSNGSS